MDDESTGKRGNLAHLLEHPHLTYLAGSVGDADLVRDLLADVDRIYHLAAAVGVALIAREPIATIERNVYPTELLLRETMKVAETGRDVRFFLASTSEVYGKNPKEKWCEDDDLVFGPTKRARWSYGASKAIDEFLALAYWRQYRLPVVIGRFFNVVGPRQTGAYGMVLPRFVEAAVAGKPLRVHDDGRQIRCFGHVDDVIGSVVELMELPAAAGRIVNIGSDEPVSILELAERVIAAAGTGAEVEFQSYADAYDEDFEDIRRRVPDLTLLHSLVGDKRKYNLDAIIGELIEQKKVE